MVVYLDNRGKIWYNCVYVKLDRSTDFGGMDLAIFQKGSLS